MILKGIALASAVIAAVRAWDGPIWWLPVYFAEYFAILFGVAVAFLLVACALVNLDKPREKESRFYRTILYPYCLLYTSPSPRD